VSIQVAEPEVQPFYTVKTLAKRLAVSERTIRNWVDRGELISYDLGDVRRFDPADVDSFLAARRDTRRAA
jgi:excisionase family DNA binding protein